MTMLTALRLIDSLDTWIVFFFAHNFFFVLSLFFLFLNSWGVDY